VATCPITRGAWLRRLVREGLEVTQAVSVLHQFTSHPRHRFWSDAVGCDTVDLSQLFGHGHVTDAYLVALARNQGGRLATFDRDLAKRAPHVTSLIAVRYLSRLARAGDVLALPRPRSPCRALVIHAPA